MRVSLLCLGNRLG
jgi:hypothetical protein